MPSIHPTAQISPDAELADDVSVGPFTVIEGAVKVAAGVTIGGHAWISGRVSIGEDSKIGWGSIVGGDPQDLSFDPAADSGVIIGPRNTLREYVTIHRGSKSGGDTVLGEGNFLMTGVHLAHDVRLGDGNIPIEFTAPLCAEVSSRVSTHCRVPLGFEGIGVQPDLAGSPHRRDVGGNVQLGGERYGHPAWRSQY